MAAVVDRLAAEQVPRGDPSGGRAWCVLVLVLVLGCALAGALRVATMLAADASLHVDEAQYWDWSRQLQWGYFTKPPAIAALIAASSAWLGDGELGVRALAMACWPAAACVLGLLAHAMMRDAGALPAQARAGAGLAALALLSSPAAAMLGLVATTDAPLMLAWCTALAALWWALVRGRHAAWWVLGLALGLGLLSKYTMAALLAGVALAVAWRCRAAPQRARGPMMRGALLAAALAAAVVAPHLVWSQAAGWLTVQHTAEITVRATGGGGLGLPAFAAAQVLLLAPLAGPAWLLRHRRTARPALPRLPLEVLALTSAPLALAGLLQAGRGGAQLNWVAPLHAAALLAWALQMGHAAPTVQRRMAAWLLLQAAVLAAWTLAPRLAAESGPDPWARMRGWAPALQEVAAVLPRDADVRVVTPSRSVMAQAAFHLRREPLPLLAWRGGAQAAHHYEARCPAAGPLGGRVWVLTEGDAVPADLAAALGPLQPVRRAVLRARNNDRRDLVLWRAASRPQGPLPEPCR